MMQLGFHIVTQLVYARSPSHSRDRKTGLRANHRYATSETLRRRVWGEPLHLVRGVFDLQVRRKPQAPWLR